MPANRILLYGASLGGGVAVDLATRLPHRALILIDTFTSLPRTAQDVYPWLPVLPLVRSQFDNLSKIGRCKQPVFIAHGTADQIIAFSHGEKLYVAANEPNPDYSSRIGIKGLLLRLTCCCTTSF